MNRQQKAQIEDKREVERVPERSELARREWELARALDREQVIVPEAGPALGMALDLAPMTSHRAPLRPSKLPGISSRILLEMEMQYPVASTQSHTTTVFRQPPVFLVGNGH